MIASQSEGDLEHFRHNSSFYMWSRNDLIVFYPTLSPQDVLQECLNRNKEESSGTLKIKTFYSGASLNERFV